jgi:hypothetical protein
MADFILQKNTNDASPKYSGNLGINLKFCINYTFMKQILLVGHWLCKELWSPSLIDQ